MTPASATTMPQDQPSFLAAVRDLCHQIYNLDKPNEIKAAVFIFEHTVCYQEFDSAKKITLDEFVNGRKRKDGSRFSPGCGISDQGNVSRALAGLEEKQVVSVKTDSRDGARRKNFYRLTLPSLDKSCQDNNIPEQTTVTLPANVVDVTTFQSKRDSNPRMNVVKVTTPTCQSNNPDLLKQQPDQSKYSSKCLEESTFNVAALETGPVAPHGASADARQDSLKEKEEDAAPAPAISPELSDSPAQANASARAGLQEDSQTDDSPDVSYYRKQLEKARNTLLDEQLYLETCDPRDRPGVERRIEQLQSSLSYFEQQVIAHTPRPPLNDKNWQQQLFGALCEVFEVPTKDLSDDLSGQIGRAANVLKRYNRKPEDVPSLYVEFKRRFAWKKGRSIGGLILDFANSAAVL